MAYLQLPGWHPTMPNGVLTDIQLILIWEAEAKEVWEETAKAYALRATRAMYQFPYATSRHAQIALNIVRYGGCADTNVVSEIASKIIEWQKDHPYVEEIQEECPEDDKAFMDMLYERQLAGY